MSLAMEAVELRRDLREARQWEMNLSEELYDAADYGIVLSDEKVAELRAKMDMANDAIDMILDKLEGMDFD